MENKTENELIEDFYVSQGGKPSIKADIEFYSSSWDMLMPVCRKIITSNPIRIQKNGVYSITDWINAQREMKKGAITFSIRRCYSGVLEFIKWYNNHGK